VRPFRENETPWMLRVWSERIQVKRAGNELIVVGTNPGEAAPRDLLELFHHYLFAPNRELEAKGLHLEFANAKSDSKLMQFVEKWGPIAAPSAAMHGWSKKNKLSYWGSIPAKKEGLNSEVRTEAREARENLPFVRAIQSAIAAVVALLKTGSASELSRQTALPAMEQLIEALTKVRQEFRKTPASDQRYQGCELGSEGLLVECKAIYQEAQGKRGGLEVSDLREFCWDMLCALLNRFPDMLVSTTRISSASSTARKNVVLPVPADGHGILPLLIFMLRQDLLAGRAYIVCQRCGEYVLQRRLAARACEGCQEALRAKLYYERKRKTILRRRKRNRRLRAKMKAGHERSR
jgi:hypothetical protein